MLDILAEIIPNQIGGGSGTFVVPDGLKFSMSAVESFPQLDTSNVTNMDYMFQNCETLIEIPQLNTQKVKNMVQMFQECGSLETIPVLNTSRVTDMTNAFDSCVSLSDESLNNIMQMCINATLITADKKKLSLIGLSSEQATTCQGLSNWTALSTAGWTTGY